MKIVNPCQLWKIKIICTLRQKKIRYFILLICILHELFGYSGDCQESKMPFSPTFINGDKFFFQKLKENQCKGFKIYCVFLSKHFDMHLADNFCIYDYLWNYEHDIFLDISSVLVIFAKICSSAQIMAFCIFF